MFQSIRKDNLPTVQETQPQSGENLMDVQFFLFSVVFFSFLLSTIVYCLCLPPLHVWKDQYLTRIEINRIVAAVDCLPISVGLRADGCCLFIYADPISGKVLLAAPCPPPEEVRW